MAKKVKFSLREKLAYFDILKKGNFLSYKTKYVLNTSDAEAVRAFAEKKLIRIYPFNGAFLSNGVEGISHRWNSSEGTVVITLRFIPTNDGKLKIIHEELDNVNHNARIGVEKSFLKNGLIKKFGLVE